MANLTTKTALIVTTATATQTLPEDAVQVVSAVGLDGAATSIAATAYTPVTSGTPTSSEVLFSGTPATPSATLTFEAALTAAGLLLVNYVPKGAIPSNL